MLWLHLWLLPRPRHPSHERPQGEREPCRYHVANQGRELTGIRRKDLGGHAGRDGLAIDGLVTLHQDGHRLAR